MNRMSAANLRIVDVPRSESTVLDSVVQNSHTIANEDFIIIHSKGLQQTFIVAVILRHK